MIIKNDLLKQIHNRFNLNIYETKVWLALLSKGIATAGQIAESSGVPRSRTYDVLESLEKRGFAIEKIGKPAKFIAVSPEVVVERLKSNLVRESEEKINTLTKIKDTADYKEIEVLHKQGIKPVHREDLSGMLKGQYNIYNHLKSMISNASKEVIMVTNATALKRKAKILKPLCEGLKRKGVTLKIAVNGDANLTDLAKEIKAKIKNTDLNARFCIVDNSQIFFMTEQNPDEDNDRGIWINSPYLASTLANMFNLVWKK